jgi:hypothetical protein
VLPPEDFATGFEAIRARRSTGKVVIRFRD